MSLLYIKGEKVSADLDRIKSVENSEAPRNDDNSAPAQEANSAADFEKANTEFDLVYDSLW